MTIDADGYDGRDIGTGVIGENQGAADAAARARLDAVAPVTVIEESSTLALEALRAATAAGEAPEATTARADTYLDWLKKNG